MLVLSRKTDQGIIVEINGEPIRIRVLGVGGDYVRLGFEGSREIKVLREELVQVHKEAA